MQYCSRQRKKVINSDCGRNFKQYCQWQWTLELYLEWILSIYKNEFLEIFDFHCVTKMLLCILCEIITYLFEMHVLFANVYNANHETNVHFDLLFCWRWEECFWLFVRVILLWIWILDRISNETTGFSIPYETLTNNYNLKHKSSVFIDWIRSDGNKFARKNVILIWIHRAEEQMNKIIPSTSHWICSYSVTNDFTVFPSNKDFRLKFSCKFIHLTWNNDIKYGLRNTWRNRCVLKQSFTILNSDYFETSSQLLNGSLNWMPYKFKSLTTIELLSV